MGSQYLHGDEANTGPRLDPWFSLEGGVHASVGGFTAWVRAMNLLNTQYETFGAYAANPKLPGSPAEPTLTPARPFQLFAGVGYGLWTSPSGDH